MTPHTWVVLLVGLWGFLFGLYAPEARALAEDPDQGAVSETMSPAEWKRQLREWLELLRANHRRRDDSADQLKARIREIRDPNAVAGLEAVLSDGGDYPRIVFLEALARIGGARALRRLVRVSVTDTNVSVRKAAAEWIGEMENRQEAVPEYIKYLRADRYSGAAAEALSMSRLTRQLSVVEEPDPALTNGLINALIVSRSKVIAVDYGRYYFGPGAGPGTGIMSGFDGRRAYVRAHYAVRNAQALKALTEYTDENYGYDRDAWRRWYQTRKNMTRNRN